LEQYDIDGEIRICSLRLTKEGSPFRAGGGDETAFTQFSAPSLYFLVSLGQYDLMA